MSSLLCTLDVPVCLTNLNTRKKTWQKLVCYSLANKKLITSDSEHITQSYFGTQAKTHVVTNFNAVVLSDNH